MAGGGNKKKKNMNSYATMGREKFSSLLAEIEEKKRKVLSEFDPREVLMIRFVSSGDDDDGKLKPLVVRGNNNNVDNKRSRNITSKQIKADEKRESSSSLAAHRSNATCSGSKETEGEHKLLERNLPLPAAGLPTRLLKEVRLTKAPRVQTTHLCVAVIVVMVLLFLGLFERYWKVYYQLEFQNQVCQRNIMRHD